MAGTHMHWFEKTYVYGEENRLRKNILFWKRQMDDIFFVWRGSRDELELFVWTLHGIEHKPNVHGSLRRISPPAVFGRWCYEEKWKASHKGLQKAHTHKNT